MEGKTAYVGSAKGELSVMVSRQDAIVAVDLLLPNVPPFTLRMNTADLVDKDGDIFYEMLGAVIMQTVEYLKSCNVPANLVEALHQELVKKATGISEDDHADRTGTGGSKLLEAIIGLEPLNSYEVPFDMPDGMIEALHQHVVTAGQKGRQRSTLAAWMLKTAWGHNRRAGWLLPDGSYEDIAESSEDPSHAQLARDSFAEAADLGDADACAFALQRGWIRLWAVYNNVSTIVQAQRVNPATLRRIQAFFGAHPEWLQCQGIELEDETGGYWDITPKQFMAANKVRDLDQMITAAFHTVQRQKDPHPLPHNFQTNHEPSIVKQNRPSLRDIVRKFKNQQNKKLTGPIFVLVYDINGRPVGVRSIKGPGWQGISGKTAAKDVTMVYDTEVPVFVNPSRTELRGLQMATGMCRGWLSGDGQTLVAWNGYVAIHSQILNSYLKNFAWGQTKNRISLEFWGKDLSVTDATRNTDWHHNPHLKQLLMASPAVRRALGGPPKEISYYDEAIVGPWDELPPEAQHTMIASAPKRPKAHLFCKKENHP